MSFTRTFGLLNCVETERLWGTFEVGLYGFHAMIWPQAFGGEMECGDLMRMASFIGSSV